MCLLPMALLAMIALATGQTVLMTIRTWDLFQMKLQISIRNCVRRLRKDHLFAVVGFKVRGTKKRQG